MYLGVEENWTFSVARTISIDEFRRKLVVLCRVRTESRPGYLPGITHTGTCVSSVHPWHNTWGTGTTSYTYPELL